MIKTLKIDLILSSLKLTVKLTSVLELTGLHRFKVHLDKFKRNKSICGLLCAFVCSIKLSGKTKIRFEYQHGTTHTAELLSFHYMADELESKHLFGK